MNTGIVNIRGKDYQTVAFRIQKFREAKPHWQLYTEIIKCDDQAVIVRCDICDEAGVHVASGHAEEFRKASQINATSALENCETSAIGRALAAAGWGGSEFASANEVQNAIHQQKAKPLRSDKSVEELEKMIRGCKTQEQLKILWAALNPDERTAVAHIKDEVKAAL
jgi:hypothetical protein